MPEHNYFCASAWRSSWFRCVRLTPFPGVAQACVPLSGYDRYMVITHTILRDVSNDSRNKRDLQDKYCARQAEMGVGDCAGLQVCRSLCAEVLLA